MVQNKLLCTHNLALMILNSQAGLLYISTPTLYHFDAYSRKMMSLLRLFFFGCFGSSLWCAGSQVVVCRLSSGMWDLGSPNKD